MCDLISRTGAIAHFDKVAEELDEQRGDDSWVGNALKICLLGVVNDLAALPSAEPKTGKWVLDPNGMDWNISAWRCSECGFMATHIGVEPNGLGDSPLNWAGSKFCPQCGARIIGYER